MLVCQGVQRIREECTPFSARQSAQVLKETNETLRYRRPKRLTALCLKSPATSSRPSLSMKSLFWGEFVAGRIERDSRGDHWASNFSGRANVVVGKASQIERTILAPDRGSALAQLLA